MQAPLRIKRLESARVYAEKHGISVRTVQRLVALPREEYESAGISRARPWEDLDMSRASWYRKGKPTKAEIKIFGK